MIKKVNGILKITEIMVLVVLISLFLMFIFHKPVNEQRVIQKDLQEEVKDLEEELELLNQNLELLSDPEIKEQYVREYYQMSECDEVLLQFPLEENEDK